MTTPSDRRDGLIRTFLAFACGFAVLQKRATLPYPDSLERLVADAVARVVERA
jgi:hypothetical protein